MLLYFFSYLPGKVRFFRRKMKFRVQEISSRRRALLTCVSDKQKRMLQMRHDESVPVFADAVPYRSSSFVLCSGTGVLYLNSSYRTVVHTRKTGCVANRLQVNNKKRYNMI
jgi:hypothetical protein